VQYVRGIGYRSGKDEQGEVKTVGVKGANDAQEMEQAGYENRSRWVRAQAGYIAFNQCILRHHHGMNYDSKRI
jgi:hypothetical protein